jgi:hypothetical protein
VEPVVGGGEGESDGGEMTEIHFIYIIYYMCMYLCVYKYEYMHIYIYMHENSIK